MSAVDVAAIKRAWPLADTLARRYGVPLRPAGPRRLRAHCPLPGHEHDREPSFVVYADQESFHCFGCGRGGDVIALVEAIEGVDFRAAIERLTGGRPPGQAPVRPPPVPAPEPARAVAETLVVRDALAAATDFYAHRLQAEATVLAYLRSRGLDAATVARHRLGLAGGLPAYLARRGLPLLPFRLAGLLRRDSDERLAGRVVIPELVGGRPTWLTGRLLPGAAHPPGAPRYESLPGPRPLLGLGRLPAGCPTVVVTEGPFDWLALRARGYPAVALGGAACSRAHLARLAAFRRIVLLLDRDDAGDQAAGRLLAALGARAVRAVLPPGVKDVGELAALPDGARRLAAVLDDLIDPHTEGNDDH